MGPGWDQLGKRTTDEDYFALLKSLKKRPLDYFKQDFNADTAVFGSRAATVCGLEFFGADKVVFASDCPFDPEGARSTSARPSSHRRARYHPSCRDKIYFRNIEKLAGAAPCDRRFGQGQGP